MDYQQPPYDPYDSGNPDDPYSQQPYQQNDPYGPPPANGPQYPPPYPPSYPPPPPEYPPYQSSNTPPYNYNYPYTPPTLPGKGTANAALILGIVSLGLLMFSMFYLALPASVVGLVLAISSRKKLMPYGEAGLATAGMILSIIALVLSLLATLAVCGLMFALFEGVGSFSSYSYM